MLQDGWGVGVAFNMNENFYINTMTERKQSFELFSCFCRLIKEEEVKKWKEHADKMRKGKHEVVYIDLLFLTMLYIAVP